MAQHPSEFKTTDVPCPFCGAAAGQTCTASDHPLKRRKAWLDYVQRNRTYEILFREGLIAEVSEAAERLGQTVPDFIETAVESRLTALRAEFGAQ
jgi:hypothetical protein